MILFVVLPTIWGNMWVGGTRLGKGLQCIQLGDEVNKHLNLDSSLSVIIFKKNTQNKQTKKNQCYEYLFFQSRKFLNFIVSFLDVKV